MAWFDAFAKDYDQWYESKLGSFVDQVEKELIEEMAKPKENEKVLDLGAGTGTYSLWLARRGLKVTALDQSKEMLNIAQEKAEKEGLKIDWHLGDAHQLPFENETFDLVVSVTAIEFMDDPNKVLFEAMRVLKPNGRLVIGLLSKESPWGELYTKKAKEDPNNLFAKAHLYQEEEIETLLPYPFQLKKGLYLPPVMEFDEKEAKKREQVKQAKQEQGAGFFVIRWDKGNGI
ncbi:class I SAM-dependent methyltransferase [Tepidibacillus sp. LV47]|uniref:class I SAM-dependent methyltransferase n=1 Tax=Tepidibacillus sp. LV47 TaxID=3398228 RepID=UPI003AAA831F